MKNLSASVVVDVVLSTSKTKKKKNMEKLLRYIRAFLLSI